jgi:competence protein ComEC
MPPVSALLGAAVFAGALIGFSLPAGVPWPAPAVALSVALLVSARGVRGCVRRRWLLTGLALAVVFGGLRAASHRPFPWGNGPTAEVIVAQGRAVRPPTPTAAGDGARFLLELEGGARTFVTVRHDDARNGKVRRGDRLRLVGRAGAIGPATNPGEPDRRAALGRRTIGHWMVVPDPGAVLVEARTASILGVLDPVRRALLERLDRACEPPDAALLGALLLGERAELAPARREAFRAAGVAHVLAVSGLHVVLLIGAGAALGRLVVPAGLRRRIALPVLLGSLCAYCALCGFQTPVLRAAVFLAVAAVAGHAGRRSRTLGHLGLAAGLLVAWDPPQALEPGFHLSFCAVAGLALLTPRLREALFAPLAILERFPEAVSRRRLEVYRKTARAVCAALAAGLATAPILAGSFGEVHPIGPVASILAIPVVAVALPAAAVCCVLGGAVQPLTGAAATALVSSLDGLVGVAGAVPFAEVPVTRAPWPIVVGALTILVAGARLRPWRLPHLLLPVAACALLAMPMALRGGPRVAQLVALDVGHGLATLVSDGRGAHVLFDAGGRAPDIASGRILPALRALGVRRLAALWISHEDSDHCSGVPAVLAALPTGGVTVPLGFGRSASGRAVVAACESLGVPLRAVRRGDDLRVGGIVLQVIHPDRGGAGPVRNERSLVAHVTAGTGPSAISAVLPGDVMGPALDALIADPTLPPARVLLLAHHGLGDPTLHHALARRLGAEVLIASAAARSAVRVEGALVTGAAGAVRVRGGGAAESWPFGVP